MGKNFFKKVAKFFLTSAGTGPGCGQNPAGEGEWRKCVGGEIVRIDAFFGDSSLGVV